MQVWSHADQRKAGFLNRAEFFNALKLVTVAQSKRELTPDIVKAALYGPASARIPAPQINLAAMPSSHSRVGAPASQVSGAPSPQNVSVRGPQGLGNASTNQQSPPSQSNHFVRTPQAVLPGTTLHPQQVLSGQSMPSGGTMTAPRPPTSNVSTDWLGGSTVSPLAGSTTQLPNRGSSPSLPQEGFGLPASSLAPSVQPRPPITSGGRAGSPLAGTTSQVSDRGISASSTLDRFGLPASSVAPSVQPRPPGTSAQTPATAPKPQAPDSKSLVVSGNGFSSDSLFGDVFSASPVQPKQDVAISGSVPTSTASVPASPAPKPSLKAGPVEPVQHAFSQPPVGGQYQQGQSAGKQNQQFAVKSTPAAASTGFPIGALNSTSSQSHVPWPKMTHSEVQKYTKVFVQVDIDRDGKITGEQAYNLFLSWRLPREVLKQVWDLSDQDNDGMLSLKEFCTALYLMERYREGRPLPTMLPSTIMPDEALFSTTSQPQAPHVSGTWGPVAGVQQPHASRPPTGKPPRPFPVPQADRSVQTTPQKSKVPELEKHLMDQLSKEEQESLNAKLKEATEADKKVEELEKEILTSREKIQFCSTKMQELILYKSRCDNRLNEITERVSGDKREVELLAKKYEEKYKQSGDVASKLTLEEATFRDIQEKKMELYQAILKMEGESGDGTLQQHADHIQNELEELVKILNDRCKQYGLRAKPTLLVELPFGWQPGIQEGTADWDEDWDKLEDEGFTFVKELTLEVQNVVAPPKPKSSSVKNETSSNKHDATASSSNIDSKSEKDASEGKDATEEKGASKEKDASKGEEISENEPAHEQNEDGLARGRPNSSAGSGATENQSKEVQDFQIMKDIGADGSPQAKETQSDEVGPESVFSGNKGFDEPSWGTFDTHYDAESVWGFDTDNSKEAAHDQHLDSSMFGLDDFNIKPIKTELFHSNNLFPGKSSSIFADSVPSTPAYSITNSPRRFSAGPDDYSFDKGKSPFIFADSVPSTPAYNFGNSPRRFSGGSEDHSFDNLSRFDSFNMHDGGLFQSPSHSLSRFDSVHSTRDSDPNYGLSSRFDSFNARDNSFNARDSGFFQSQNSLARFDSMRSTKDFDHGHGFPAFESFDDTDPFGTTGPSNSKTSVDTPRNGSGVLAFDDTDPFGSTGPFKTSVESNTQKRSSDNWNAF
ncbi:hypothetical protein CISIN_1g000940mg [Citrus sinensis]|uniref:Uncharacterized protein n=1 Tax=Citrus sinensis TaxID=2711 RepID=A0A067FVY2_CITSI|nr:hypothetical protein CISIN_1g000940mg [Citrus sinensis]